ncbi:MAG: hypothetical protein M1339_04575, partial [Bacteroidetes bacterium]|nr:hypothetical protein [Bacteroidota bacterium]
MSEKFRNSIAAINQHMDRNVYRYEAISKRLLFLLGFILLALAVISGFQSSQSPSHYTLLEYHFSLVAAAVFFLSVFVLQMGGLDKISRIRIREGAFAYVMVFVLLFIISFEQYFGNRQFGGYDLSMLVDVGWRQYIGQEVYKDFICTLPAGFYLGAKYAFLAFGVAWNSLCIVNTIYTVGTLIWLYFLLKWVVKNKYLALFLSFLCEALSTMLVAHYWHSSITAVAASIYLLSAFIFLRTHGEKIIWNVSYVTSLFLLLLMKPNVAFPLIILATLSLLLTDWNLRIRTLFATLIAIISVYGFLKLNGIEYSTVLSSYFSVDDRGVPKLFFVGMDRVDQLGTFFLMVVLLVIAGVSLTRKYFSSGKKIDIGVLIVLSGFVSGLIGLGTDWELKLIDFPLLFMS